MAVPVPTNTKVWTLEELHSLPDDGNKYELVHGDLFVTPAPTVQHEEILVRLTRILAPFVTENGLGEVYHPRAVIQFQGSEVEPDLMVRQSHPDPPSTTDRLSIVLAAESRFRQPRRGVARRAPPADLQLRSTNAQASPLRAGERPPELWPHEWLRLPRRRAEAPGSQLAKPYSRAITCCASASRSSLGWRARNEAGWAIWTRRSASDSPARICLRSDFASLRSYSRLGSAGSERGRGAIASRPGRGLVLDTRPPFD